MFELLVQVWQNYQADKPVQEAIVDTLVLALDMKTVFTEMQLTHAVGCLLDIFKIQDDQVVMHTLRDSVTRVNASELQTIIQRIYDHLHPLTDLEREPLMKLAIVSYHFSAEDDERPPMNDSHLPHLALALDVSEAIPRLLEELREAVAVSKAG